MCGQFHARRTNETRGHFSVEPSHQFAPVLRQQDNSAHGTRGFDGTERAGLQQCAESLEPGKDVVGPLRELLGVLNAPGFALSGTGIEEESLDALHASERLKQAAHALPGDLFVGIGGEFVKRLGAIEQEALVGAKDSAGTGRVARQYLEVAGFPAEYLPEGFFAASVLDLGIDDIAALDPDSPLEGTAGDAEDAGVLGKALYLDKIHEALAVDATKTAVGAGLREKRINALAEEANLGRGGRFLSVKIDAGRVGACPVLLIAKARNGDGAERGETLAGTEEDLKAIDLRHAEICDKKGEGLCVKQGECAGGAGSDTNLGTAGQAAKDAAVGIEELLVIVEDENAAARGAGRGATDLNFKRR